MSENKKKMLFLANMQIISLNMHNTKMPQAKIDSTEKTGLETTKKLLVHIFIELLWEYPCLLVSRCYGSRTRTDVREAIVGGKTRATIDTLNTPPRLT